MFRQDEFMPVKIDASLGELVEVVATSKRNIFPVIDDRNHFHGYVSLEDIRQDMFKKDLYDKMHVYNFMVSAPAYVYVDEMHFTNVVFNLMDNAMKYKRPDVPLDLEVRTWNAGGKFMLSIKDNGIGIKKEHLKKIFDRFFRVTTGNVHDVKGFGLGLAYVKQIVVAHKGSIRAESEPGVGTTFVIVLPLK